MQQLNMFSQRVITHPPFIISNNSEPTHSTESSVPLPLCRIPLFTNKSCACGVHDFFMDTHKTRSIISIGGPGNICLGRAIATAASHSKLTIRFKDLPTGLSVISLGKTQMTNATYRNTQKRAAQTLFHQLNISQDSPPSLEQLAHFQTDDPLFKVVVIEAVTNDIIYNPEYIFQSKIILYWTPKYPSSPIGHFDVISDIHAFQMFINRLYYYP